MVTLGGLRLNTQKLLNSYYQSIHNSWLPVLKYLICFMYFCIYHIMNAILFIEMRHDTAFQIQSDFILIYIYKDRHVFL